MPRVPLKHAISDAWERHGLESGLRQVIVPTLRELIRRWNEGSITLFLDEVEVGTRSLLNLIAGKDISITLVDNTAEERVDATIARADKALNSASVSGAITFDLSGVGRHFRRTLTGNVTSITISAAPVEVGNWLFDFVQDATGSRTLPVATASWPSSSTFTDSIPPVLDATALGHNWVTLYYDGTLYHWLTGCNPSMAV